LKRVNDKDQGEVKYGSEKIKLDGIPFDMKKK
jgi:hypothetical protein